MRTHGQLWELLSPPTILGLSFSNLGRAPRGMESLRLGQPLGKLSLDTCCPRRHAQTRMRNFWSNFLTHPGGFRPSQKVGTKLFCLGVLI